MLTSRPDIFRELSSFMQRSPISRGSPPDCPVMTEQQYIHPAFPQPPDPSVAIWRYMDASKFTWLVANGRLFMPRADRLGDPFEGTTPSGELEWWKREAANADTDESRGIIEYNRSFLSRMATML